jgi:hypothetical protein
MRIPSILLAAAVAALAWSAQAQTAGDDAPDHYFAELDRQCPSKLLQDLSSPDLRDGLDQWIEGQSPDAQDQIRAAENTLCAPTGAGAACVDQADIGAADRLGLTSDLAGSICASFLRCRSQGDCDHAE